MNKNLESGDSEDLMKSNLAMRVAVQTMKERCQSLQQRVTSLEEENFCLRSRIEGHNDKDFQLNFSGKNEEIENLHQRLAELHQQNGQLNEHVAMVANENRHLWSRLSQLSKERNNQQNTLEEVSRAAGGTQNLIRSKTFTQHSPNPNLRHKHLQDDGTISTEIENLSLEDIILNDTQLQQNNSDKTNSLRFSCFNHETDSFDKVDLVVTANKCIDETLFLKKELLKQQEGLNIVFNGIKNKLASRVCTSCKIKRKPETADKSLETDESIHIEIKSLKTNDMSKNETESPLHLDLLNEKRIADQNDKICPICGGKYGEEISFDDFSEHVTTHFIDDDDLDPAGFDRNFEMISHTVGNF